MSENIVETPQESTLKRYAKAFYAKIKAAKARVVALVGDNETPIREDEGTARKIARVILSVPKWIGHSVVVGTRIVLWAVNAVVGLAALFVAIIAVALAVAVAIVTLAIYKVVQLFALILRTPYLLVRGDDCLKTDWVGYLNLWKPKYFYFTRISQVFLAQETEEQVVEEPVLSVVHDRTKNEPTPKQEKTYPARMPVLVEA